VSASVTVRYWAGAQRAAGTEVESLTAETIGELRALLQERPALASVAAVASFLVDGQQAAENTMLHDGAEIDVLPPFAGGCC
jgi:molybdopterin converting factor small subunit